MNSEELDSKIDSLELLMGAHGVRSATADFVDGRWIVRVTKLRDTTRGPVGEVVSVEDDDKFFAVALAKAVVKTPQ